MSKGTFFTGQPIYSQVLNFIPRSLVHSASREFKTDYYCKSFTTYQHLVTMLYAIFNQCNSLREVTTGLLAWDQRIYHLGINSHPRRSTISDANKRRTEQVFEKIYIKLLSKYEDFLSDSRKNCKKSNLYIFDSSTVPLFQEILKGSGLSKDDGRRKGGIKVHTLLRSDQDVPCMIRYSAAACNDRQFLKLIQLPKGSFIVFDRGYRDYKTYNRFSEEGINWITRHIDHSVYQVIQNKEVSELQKQKGVVSDKEIILGHNHQKKAVKVRCRIIKYHDPVSLKTFEFLTNNFKLSAVRIAEYYQKRWQIETFFKRIKQNYPLRYFLGDNENAIKIQIWCALIADLLLKVIRKGSRTSMSFSNMNSLIRLHLMTYMGLTEFLRSPEKSLLRKIRMQKNYSRGPTLFL